VHRTFEKIVACKELTVGTGDLMQTLNSSNSIACSYPDIPHQQNNQGPGSYKTKRSQNKLENMN
jgi:hypothetical protein